MTKPTVEERRTFLKSVGALGLTVALPRFGSAADATILKVIPSTGERLPAIGMGSWITFNVRNETARDVRVEVLKEFFARGGSLVDSSPMYGRSEQVIGYCLERLGTDSLFSATKVWIFGKNFGIGQMNNSEDLWGVDRFDLMQIHNMLDWQKHLRTLEEWKGQGRIRYIGITTSHGRRHRQMERVIAEQDAFDFVQFTYNIADREAEQRLLPMAAEHGKAVIINRPFRGGGLFRSVQGKPLPDWASEIDCENWAQFFLKFVVSHPAVTCAIPATSRVDHMQENIGALCGRLPDPDTRERMARYYERV